MIALMEIGESRLQFLHEALEALTNDQAFALKTRDWKRLRTVKHRIKITQERIATETAKRGR